MISPEFQLKDFNTTFSQSNASPNGIYWIKLGDYEEHTVECIPILHTTSRIGHLMDRYFQENCVWTKCILAGSLGDSPRSEIPAFLKSSKDFKPINGAIYELTKSPILEGDDKSPWTPKIIYEAYRIIYVQLHHRMSTINGLATIYETFLYRKSISIKTWSATSFLISMNPPLKIGEGGFKEAFLEHKVKILSAKRFHISRRVLLAPKLGKEGYITFNTEGFKHLHHTHVWFPLQKNIRIRPEPQADGTLKLKHVYLDKLGINLVCAGVIISNIPSLCLCMYTLLSGLRYMHSQDRLQRDLKMSNCTLFPQKTKDFVVKITDSDDRYPICLEKLSVMPVQTRHLIPLHLRKAVLNASNNRFTIPDMHPDEYRRAWKEGSITYHESFTAECNSMGLTLAELYMHYMHTIRPSSSDFPAIEAIERAIYGLSGYPVRNSEGILCSNILDYLRAIDINLSRISTEETHRIISSCISLEEAMEILLPFAKPD